MIKSWVTLNRFWHLWILSFKLKMQWTADIQSNPSACLWNLLLAQANVSCFVHHVQRHRNRQREIQTWSGTAEPPQCHAPGGKQLYSTGQCALTEGTVLPSSGEQDRAGAACREQGSGDALRRILLWLHRMHFKNHDTSGNSHPKLNIYWLTALRRIQELPQTTVKIKNMYLLLFFPSTVLISTPSLSYISLFILLFHCQKKKEIMNIKTSSNS